MRREPERESRWTAGTIAALTLGVLVLGFVLANTRHTDIRFIGPVVSAPIWLAIATPFLLGVVVGWLVARERHRD
jgi:uncharacterized integral membrane protein